VLAKLFSGIKAVAKPPVSKKLAKPASQLKKEIKAEKKQTKQLKQQQKQDEATVAAMSDATAAAENAEYVKQMNGAVEDVRKETAAAIKQAETILSKAQIKEKSNADRLAELSLDPEYYEVGQEPTRASLAPKRK